jgi:hypothetical protein
MEDGDKQTAQWYLERKKKDEFSVRQENAISGDIKLKGLQIVIEQNDK